MADNIFDFVRKYGVAPPPENDEKAKLLNDVALLSETVSSFSISFNMAKCMDMPLPERELWSTFINRTVVKGYRNSAKLINNGAIKVVEFIKD